MRLGTQYHKIFNAVVGVFCGLLLVGVLGKQSMHVVLFASQKQGGILQSSGFLDLKSLMALGRTAKSNAFDELSLIRLIEHELTTHNP